MAIRITSAIRTSLMDLLVDSIDGGSPGTVKVYTGAQPATADSAVSGTLLATFTLNNPAYGAAAAGVATLSVSPAISTTAVASGTAGWARVANSAGTTVYDGTVGTSGTDFILNSTTVANGQTVRIVSGTLTFPV